MHHFCTGTGTKISNLLVVLKYHTIAGEAIEAAFGMLQRQDLAGARGEVRSLLALLVLVRYKSTNIDTCSPVERCVPES